MPRHVNCIKMKEFKDKVVVITGGNSGIGLAIAHLFKSYGASIVIFGRDEKKLKLAVKDLEGKVLSIQGDVRNVGDLERLFKCTYEEYGKVDTLIANAGILRSLPIEKVDENHYDETFDINLKGVFFTVQKSLSLLKNGSSIILISSIANAKGYEGLSVYNASKAAVRSLARSLASELAPKGIRANAISPGFIKTSLLDWANLTQKQWEEAEKEYEKIIPMQRRGIPEEVASVALFLASQDARYITGSDIVVDGGITQK